MTKIGGIDTTSAAGASTSAGAASSAARTKDTQNLKSSSVSSNTTNEDELQSLELNETSNTAQTDAVSQIQTQAEETQKQYEEQIKECMLQMQKLQQQLSQIESQRSSLLSQTLNPDIDIDTIISGFSELNNSKTKIYTNMQKIMLNIKTLQDAIEQNKISTQDAISQIQALQAQSAALSNNINSSGIANLSAVDTNTDVGNISAQMGLTYVGVINSDAEGNAEFSPGGASQHWCADFATAITKRAYEAKGLTIPEGFGSSSVEGLRSWGASNGRYTRTADMGGSKGSYIAQNIKPGDLIIQQENGASHTGIVTKVYPDGSFDTVEGNSSDAVKSRHYDANSDRLSGFVKMS